MHPRASELIERLSLAPHPEGGFFVRVFRSDSLVKPHDSRAARPAFSAIHFLLAEGAISRWHRVLSDEAWHHYEGSPLELLSVPPHGGAIMITTLGPVSGSTVPLHVVPAGWWQAARPLGPYAFIGCSLGPAFDYDDFMLLDSLPESERPAIMPKSLLQQYL